MAPESRTAFIENMARALTRLATSPEERTAMGQAAHARVIHHFDWEVKIDRMLDLYRSVIPAAR